MKFSTHLESSEAGNRLMDPDEKYAPLEQNLLIMNYTKLYINFEGCVNTLSNECEKFHTDYGGDGKDMRSQSRYVNEINKTLFQYNYVIY